jgi:hypothetical protein
MSMPIVSSVLMAAAIVAQDDVARVIHLHDESLARVKSIHIKTETWKDPSQVGAADKPRKLGTTETWRKGLSERFFERIFEISGPNGVTSHAEGLLIDRSFNGKEVRALEGWDPEKASEEPLSFTDRITFAKVSGTILSRDSMGTASPVWRFLLFEVYPRVSLAQAADSSEIVLLPPKSPGTVLLEIKASKNRLLVGMRIELDKEHGYRIRRIVQKTPKALEVTTEVKEFLQPAEGIWVPRQLITTLPWAPPTRIEVVGCRVNGPIAEAVLKVRFPEGARVSETEKGLFHIWGKDGPAKTFKSEKDLFEYVCDVMKRE